MKYEIKGTPLPVVICHLDSGEKMITERGSMSWMSPNMHMETSTNGGIGKVFGRMFSGESIIVDTGYLAAMDTTCSMDIQAVPGLKNMVFGGEGVFNTIVRGPGKVMLQTMPLANVAGVLRSYFPSKE